MDKTLLITLEYPPMIGGVANYYQNLVQQLPEGQVLVLDNNNGELLTDNKLVWPRWIKGIISAYKQIKEHEIDHILVGQILPVGTIAFLLYMFFGIKYTVMTHAMDLTVPFGASGSTHKQKLMRLILKHAHRVTTVSTFTKMQLESLLHVPPQNIAMVYPCPHINGTTISAESVDLDALNNKYNIQGKRIILSVGRLVKRKGVDHTIKAIKQIASSKQYTDMKYVVVGDGPYRAELEQLVEACGLTDTVIFTGRVEDKELIQWYSRCELFVMPSRELYNADVEGFGIVYLEANSFGKPVIGGKSGGVLDAVHDGENGYIVNPDDVTMIATAIERILNDTEEAHAMGQRGKERVQTMFRWSVQAKKLEEILS